MLFASAEPPGRRADRSTLPADNGFRADLGGAACWLRHRAVTRKISQTRFYGI
jgi:hypothetical protein